MAEKPESQTDRDAVGGGHDAPVTLREHDDLHRWPVARAIHRVIATSPPGWATRIGLYGKWGSGKTTVLNFLEQLETEQKAVVVKFSAWSAVGEAGVISLLYEALEEKLKERDIAAPKVSAIKSALQRGARWLRQSAPKPETIAAIDAAKPGLGSGLAVAGGLALSTLGVNLDDLEKLINAARQNGSGRIIVFIDDLDRADPRVLPKTLLALREMLDWPDFTFVLAFDKDVVASALGDYSKAFGDAADRFLEKIVDVPFVLPTPSTESVKRLATRALRDCCDFIPVSDRNRLAEWLPANPRTAKLVARSLGALRDVAMRHDREEIDWFGLGLQTTLRIAAPRVADEIERTLLGAEAPYRIAGATESREHREPQAVIREIVDKHAPADFGHADRRWLERLAEVLKGARHRFSGARIGYEMNLLVDEPAFTGREFRQFVQDFSARPSDEVVAPEFAAARLRSGKDDIEIADDLLSSLTRAYGESLHELANARELEQFENMAAVCARYLGALEYFWRDCQIPSVVAEVRSSHCCESLYSTFIGWRHFDRNTGDKGLRARELDLLRAAAGQCTEPMKLYGATDPSDHPLTLGDPQQHRDWIDQVQSGLVDRVVETALGWFSESGGVARTALTDLDQGLGARLIESAESLLYRDRATVDRLTRIFETAANQPCAANAGIVRDNALAYLIRLTDGRRDGSFMRNEDRSNFVKTHKRLLSAAWRATSSVEHQYRTHEMLRKLRTDLIQFGVSKQMLKLPPWLRSQGGAIGSKRT